MSASGRAPTAMLAPETTAPRAASLPPLPPAALLGGTNGALVIVTEDGTSAILGGDGRTLLRTARGDASAPGLAVYLRDLSDGAVWSVGRAPVAGEPDAYEARWLSGSFEIRRLERGIEATLEHFAAAFRDVRRLTLANRTRQVRCIEVVTYGEVVLDRIDAYTAHPAFSKIFIQTEWSREAEALLARRRPREPEGGGDPKAGWQLFHALSGPSPVGYETDRVRFFGERGRTGVPAALRGRVPRRGATGNVLDPIVSLRRTFVLMPEQSAEAVMMLGRVPPHHAHRMARQAALRLESIDSICTEAVDGCGVGVRHLARLDALAAALALGTVDFPHPEPLTAEARRALSALGLHGGPYVLYHGARGADAADGWPEAFRYWAKRRVPFECIVLAMDGSSAAESNGANGHGEALIVRESEISSGLRRALCDGAELVVHDSTPLPDVVSRAAVSESAAPRPKRRRAVSAAALRRVATPSASRGDEERLFEFNGYGGFTRRGDEYVIRIRHDPDRGHVLPPAPWVNVIANERFGTIVSETGAGATWSQNSREHRLTPWSNDALRDPHGEALYLRDQATGEVWSPLPGPMPAAADYEMRHGFGYSRCLHHSHGLEQETTVFVAAEAPVKLTRVRLVNRSRRVRHLALDAWQRLVLGVDTARTAQSIETDRRETVLLARNPAAGAFASGVAFASCSAPSRDVSATADGVEYLGDGGVARPAAVIAGTPLGGRFGSSGDPCFAQRVAIELTPGASWEATFVLGEVESVEEALALADRFNAAETTAELERVRERWWSVLGRVRVRTPEPAIDRMANGWLAYQTLSCRLWGRTAFYQSGGAFGFRDQLQDAVSLIAFDPALARRQIVLHAEHQFVEGDVLHWWHPVLEAGIRTRFADDLLWLPWAVAEYVSATGDASVLDERAHFLEGPLLEPGEDERFLRSDDYTTSREDADVYTHCCRALDRSLATGAHGLPLFGTGDWNDGMNRVGREGRGESVWMAFFLISVIDAFAPIGDARGDRERAERYRAHRAALVEAVNHEAWDGGWYLRGWYDDGAALGTRRGDECKIDALAQAWSVISRAAPPARAKRALDAVERHLIREDDGIVRLLTPPFEHTPHDPGYIKGYVPGVRENGGQYTHAALWVVRALAELGRRDRAASVLAMLSPLSHTRTARDVRRYKVEPYVVAADVYGADPHVGRGGWTWYTGSAGWMLRVTLESVLGVRWRDGAALEIAPRIPDEWPGFEVEWRHPTTGARYEIRVRNPKRRARGVKSATLDGRPLAIERGAVRVPLANDGAGHRIDVVLG